MRRLLASLNTRLFFSHVLVASLTGVIIFLLVLVPLWFYSRHPEVSDYRELAMVYAQRWLFQIPDDAAFTADSQAVPGWTLVVSAQDEVLWVRGDTSCREAMLLQVCAPELVGKISGERRFERDGNTWTEVILSMVTGERVILQRGVSSATPIIDLGIVIISGYGSLLLFAMVVMGLLAVPVALPLVWLIARPQIRRIAAISQASQRFANGEFRTRVQDAQADEIGQLAQHFDDMANVLEQNVASLRDLAQRNASLAAQAEQAAIQAERARLSRDLHDAIAQRLFSLSMSTATLPDVIVQSQTKGVQQAQLIAELAEQTLLDLRGLLVDLRPSTIEQQGLSSALKVLCQHQQAAFAIPIECTLLLSGKFIPTVVEDTIYRVTQEALSNVVKHANATKVEITLVEGRRQMTLSITDNGRGFVVDGAGFQGKFGLISMRERVQSVGGNLSFESSSHHGTTVQALLPLQGKGEGEG